MCAGGNFERPHHLDIPLSAIARLLLSAEPRALLFEGANPRHAHEWRVWREVTPPDNYVLIPGVIDSTTSFLEHPEVVAERIGRSVGLVGRERISAGADCGCGTFAGLGAVDAEIAWAKRAALAEGAALVQ